MNVTNVTLKIDGMHCGGCVKRVTEALSGMAGVSDVEVDLEKGQATLNAKDGAAAHAALLEKIDDLGFDAKIL